MPSHPRTRRRPTRPPPKSIPLWRFFVAAAVIVALIGSLMFARRAGPPDLRVSARVTGTPTPTAERPDGASPAPNQAAFVASGAWTMSSLPSCFFEQDHRIGRTAALRYAFPAAAQRIAPGTTFRWGNCTVSVRTAEVWISRDGDRLRVPPDARLYRVGDRLVLVSIDGIHAEIRRYCRRFDAVGCPAQSFPSPQRRLSV